jgi:hypothetical protein
MMKHQCCHLQHLPPMQRLHLLLQVNRLWQSWLPQRLHLLK